MLTNTYLNGNDKTPFYNMSDNEKKYFCTVLNDKESEKEQKISGLGKDACTLVIICNGRCSVTLADKIKILNKEYRIAKLTEQLDYKLANIRSDVSAFPGKTTIFLKG